MGEIADKSITRQIARDFGLSVADKPDSQEICFVSEAGGYVEFLRKSKPEMFQPGEIVDSEGKPLGEHEGIAAFTVGQRKGIRLTARNGRPLYVLGIQPASRKVVVGMNEELLTHEVQLEDVYWGSIEPTESPIKVQAMSRP